MTAITGLGILLILIGYLTGSISSAIVFCKLAGLPDPRTQGSGNPGATNVLRFGGKKLAVAVLFVDVLKGVLPVLIAQSLSLPTVWVAAVALATFLGHVYPIFFQFKGGKGVATALGCFLALNPLLALAVLATWIVVFVISRISSLSALVAAALAPVYSLWLLDSIAARYIVLVMVMVLIMRHHANIRRLIAGEESKSG